MIVFAAPLRPFSSREQSLSDRFRTQLTPTAERLQHNALVAQANAQAIPTPRSPRGASKAAAERAEARRRYRQQARQTLEREAARTAPPCGLGVIELAILKWVIGQMLSWIMREWLEGKDGDDAEQDD